MSFKSAREKAGISVSKVMEVLKISDAAVYQWESGDTFPRTDKLLKIAALYGCTVDELLKPDDPG